MEECHGCNEKIKIFECSHCDNFYCGNHGEFFSGSHYCSDCRPICDECETLKNLSYCDNCDEWHCSSHLDKEESEEETENETHKEDLNRNMGMAYFGFLFMFTAVLSIALKLTLFGAIQLLIGVIVLILYPLSNKNKKHTQSTKQPKVSKKSRVFR